MTGRLIVVLGCASLGAALLWAIANPVAEPAMTRVDTPAAALPDAAALSPETADVPPIATISFGMAVDSGRLHNRRIRESSGLAVSTRDPHLLWTLNDSGGGAELFALDPTGADRGSVRLSDGTNRDWEDLAAYRTDAGHFLAIADTGDNGGAHKTSSVLIVREPVPGEDGRFSGEIAVERRVGFRYVDGPRDVEALAVDAGGSHLYLLTKRLVPAVLYRLDLPTIDGSRDAEASATLVAHRVGQVDTLPAPTAHDVLNDPVLGSYAAQPTAMDFSADGTFAAVLTYKAVYLYRRDGDEDWPAVFSRRPEALVLPGIQQAESLAIGEQAIYVTSERTYAPLLRYDRLVSSP